jgi:Flp pilus assembly pilin Flp
MKQKFIAYLKDESGQTSTEYILLVAVAAAIVIKFKGAITTQLLGEDGSGEGGVLGNVFKGVNANIDSGLLK